MVDFVIDFLRNYFSANVGVFLAGTLPVTELRAAIPLGVSLGMEPWVTFFYAVLGNLLPIPILLALLPRLLTHVPPTSLLGRALRWCVRRTLKRTKRLERLGALGLMIFVLIPLPGTGAWTASLAAVLFRISPSLALPSISIGVVGAGIIVTLLSIGLFH
ncbi:MAG: COG2426 family protein [Limnochordia bacterium]